MIWPTLVRSMPSREAYLVEVGFIEQIAQRRILKGIQIDFGRHVGQHGGADLRKTTG